MMLSSINPVWVFLLPAALSATYAWTQHLLCIKPCGKVEYSLRQLCCAVPGWIDTASCDDPEQSCQGCCATRGAHLYSGQPKVHSWVWYEDLVQLTWTHNQTELQTKTQSGMSLKYMGHCRYFLTVLLEQHAKCLPIPQPAYQCSKQRQLCSCCGRTAAYSANSVERL